MAAAVMAVSTVACWAGNINVLHIGDAQAADVLSILPQFVRACPGDVSGITVYSLTADEGSLDEWQQMCSGTPSRGYRVTRVLGKAIDAVPEGAYDAGDDEGLTGVLDDFSWDVIVVQPSASEAASEATTTTTTDSTTVDSTATTTTTTATSVTASYMTALVQMLKDRQTNARVAYVLMHSPEHSNSTTTRAAWQDIVTTTREVMNTSGADVVLPIGTALENMRLTSRNTIHDLTLDGERLGCGLARYTAASCYYQQLLSDVTGIDVSAIPYRYICTTAERALDTDSTRNIDVMAAAGLLARRAAALAVKYPYAVVNPETTLRGDVNQDTRVNVSDITTTASVIMTPELRDDYPLSDVNEDNRVNVADITTIASFIFSPEETQSIEVPGDTLWFDIPTVDLTKDTLRILMVGDGNTSQATSMVYKIAAAAGTTMTNIALYTATIDSASCGATWHAIYNGYDTTTVFNVTRVMGTAPCNLTAGTYTGTALQTAITGAAWDIVIMQHDPAASTEYAYLFNDGIVEWTRDLHTALPDAQIGFLLTHSYWGDDEDNAQGSSLDMWQAIADTWQEAMSRNGVNLPVAVGTAVEDMRTTSFNNAYDLTMNGKDMGYGLAQYVMSACLFETLIAPHNSLTIAENTARHTLSTSQEGTQYPCYNVVTTNVFTAQCAATLGKRYPFEVRCPDVNAADTVGCPIRSIAIFGTSRTSSMYLRQGTGWVGEMLDSLMTADGYISMPTASRGGYGYYTARRFVVSRSNHRITKIGATFTTEIDGRYATAVRVLRPESEYAACYVGVYCDGELIKVIDNTNPDLLGDTTITFTGDGATRSFFLPDLKSRNFTVLVDSVSQTVSMDPSSLDTESTATKSDCYAVRTVMANGNGEVQRVLYFPEPPTGTITVTYDRSDVVAYYQNGIHTNSQKKDEATGYIIINDSTSVASYETAPILSPVYTDDRAAVFLDLGSEGHHTVVFKILAQKTTGSIYFDLDFVTPTYYRVLNASFAGYRLKEFFGESRYRDVRALRYLPNPDIVVLEYGGNDENEDIDRVALITDTIHYGTLLGNTDYKAKHFKTVTQIGNPYLELTRCTGTIDSIGEYALRSSDLVGTKVVKPGYYVRIGEYHSDWNEFVIRRVATVDTVAGIITWEDNPFSPDSIWHYTSFEEMQGAMFAIRSHTPFKNNLTSAVKRIHALTPSSKVYLMGISPYHDNGYNTGWAYDEAMQDVAAANNAHFIGVQRALRACADRAMAASPESYTITIDSATTEYSVPAASVTNQFGQFRVYINDEDVTGTRALAHSNIGYHVKNNAAYSMLYLSNSNYWMRAFNFCNYDTSTPVDVTFYGTPPSTSDVVKLVWNKSGTGWTSDGVHQIASGDATIGGVMQHVFDNY